MKNKDKFLPNCSTKRRTYKYDKTFSKRYFTLAKDEALLRTNASKNFLKAFHLSKEFTVEIIGNTMIVKTGQLISKKSAYIITEFISQIQNEL